MSTMDPKEKFYRQFQNSVVTIQDQISQLPSFAAVGGERQDAVEHILSGISRLSLQVADAAEYVPAYDQRTYSDVVKALTDQVNAATAKLAPKNRFQFKKRAATAPAAEQAKPDTRRLNPMPGAAPSPAGGDNGTVASSSKAAAAGAEDTTVGALPTTATSPPATKNYNAEIASTPSGAGIRKPSFSAARSVALSDHSRVHIALPVSAARATSAGGTLTNLDRCVVDMTAPTASAPFASLAMKDIEGSVVVAGRVDGPVHVTGVRGSVVAVAARQVRIHECRDVVFYLHCGSRPIIEDCEGVRFVKAPEFLLTDKEKSETNMFDQVDDFKWLKAAASPNWSLLPESEAIPEEVWKKALAGGPNVVIDDTLRELRVGQGA